MVMATAIDYLVGQPAPRKQPDLLKTVREMVLGASRQPAYTIANSSSQPADPALYNGGAKDPPPYRAPEVKHATAAMTAREGLQRLLQYFLKF